MTTLVKWAPFRELDAVERRMQRMFGEVFTPFIPSLPAADVYETPDEFVVELEVPGYEEKELGIEISDHTVTVTGAHQEVKEGEERTFWLHERLGREFERHFALPPEADTEHVRAVFKKGVLEVHAPKLQTAEPRKVEISKA